MPFVVGPGVLIAEEDLDWQVGQYGGTRRTARNNVNWNPDVFVMNNEPLVMGPGISGEDIIPGVVQDYEVNDEFSEFTFSLRKGLKWSVGTPITTEDVRFAYEDVLLNEKLTPVFPSWMRSGNSANGEPMTLEIIDDFSFRISFDEQYGGFLTQLTNPNALGFPMITVPLYKENESRGGYRTVLLRSHTEPATLYFNMTHPDPVWRNVVGDVRFRKAVSLSLDHEQIIDAVWLDIGAELPELQPSEYDPQEARALLDEMGLDERDAEGYRVGPDGEEPPPVVREFLELTGRAITALPEDRVEIREQYQQIQYDNIFFITPVEKERRPIIAKNNLANVAHDGFSIASCFAGEQFFFK